MLKTPSVSYLVLFTFDRLLYVLRTCAVCGDKHMLSAKVLPSIQRTLVFLKRGVFIPPGSRCCSGHLVNRQLTMKSFDQIPVCKPDRLTLDSVGLQVLLEEVRAIVNCRNSFDFDDPTSLDDEAYKTIVGLTKGSSLWKSAIVEK